MAIKVHEAQVEDALAVHPDIFANITGISGPISLLFRQHSLPSGRLDLLYAAGNELILVELKVESCQPSFVEQVLGYATDLQALQERESLVQAPIKPYLLCPSFSERQRNQCQRAGVIPVSYSPEEVLHAFFLRLHSIAHFVSIKPSDHGIWNIRLIHQVLYALVHPSSVGDLAIRTTSAEGTVANQLRFATELSLVRRQTDKAIWSLTDLGIRYVAERDKGLKSDAMTEGQRKLLRDHIVKDPFASPTIFGIYSILDCLFTLARNVYPVDESMVLPYFRDTCGKRNDWKAQRSMMYGVRMFSNYAIELGLLAKADKRFLITPEGIRFVLLLQLHKGIAMVDAVGHHEFL